VARDLHPEIVTACCWSPSGEELITCADDKTIKKLEVDGLASEVLVQDTDGFITDMSWCPSLHEKQGSDILAVSCSDGTLRILQASNGRVEKKVEAYKACAAISVAWNQDGSAIATGGEDGCVKVWSRVGMLRNNAATVNSPVYCVCWGRQDELLFSSGRILTIEQKERKQIQWKAHEGTILSVEWNMVNNLIVSGGEDCKFRVWDSFGRQLFQSKPLEHVVTCVKWAPNGSCFAVGSFNMLRLCDKTGWTYCREDLHETGSVLGLCWTQDGTMIGAATASGSAVVGQITNHILEFKHFQVSMKDARQVEVYNTLDDTTEILAFRDRILDISLGYEFLLIYCSTLQVHVYNVHNLGAPQIIDVTQTKSALLIQSAKVFMAAWSIFTYEGRRVCSSQCLNGINFNVLGRETVAVNEKFLAVLENSRDAIRLIDIVKQQPIGLIKHKLEITQIALCNFQEDILVFTDRNGDLFLHSNGKKTYKLPATMVQSMKLHDESDALVACVDGGNRIITWYFPQVVWIDPDLLADTSEEIDMPQLSGQQPQILSFVDNMVTVRRHDGSITTSTISRYPALLHQLIVEQRKWEDGIRLCRFVNQQYLWAVLAAMAIKYTHLDTAEIALAATEHVDKLHYILHIKDLPSETAKMAELALYKRDIKGAEQILLHANPPLLYRAIKVNIRLFRWERARKIAKGQNELLTLVDLYEKRWESQEPLSNAEMKQLKQIKIKHSDKSYDSSDDEGDEEEKPPKQLSPKAPPKESESKSQESKTEVEATESNDEDE